MVEVKVWPDGSWVYIDEPWEEDFSDDYMIIIVPDEVEDIDSFVSLVQNI